MPKAEIKGFNFARVDTVAASNRGAECELVDADGKATGVFFKVLGSDSDVWRSHINERANKQVQAKFKAQRGAGRPADIPNVEDAKRDGVLLLTMCTVGWRDGDKPTITWGDEELPFSPANAERVYTELPFIYSQIDEFIGDMGNFI